VLERPRYGIERYQPFLRAFVSSYARRVPEAPAERHAWLEAVADFAAARMILLVLEAATLATVLPASSYYQLQLALNLSRQPGETTRSFLGLDSFCEDR
jgi:hypothetical protein